MDRKLPGPYAIPTRGRTMVGMGVGTMDVDKGGIIRGTGVSTGVVLGVILWCYFGWYLR